MPIVTILFKRTEVDIVSPFPPAMSQYKYTLAIVDYTTQYPKAMPLRNIRAETMAWELALLLSRVGFPKQVVTDQGTSFMSKTLQALWKYVRVQPLHASVYYPQTNGVIEWFNLTLKLMFWKFVAQNGGHSCCSQYNKNLKHLQGSPHLICSMAAIPGVCWML